MISTHYALNLDLIMTTIYNYRYLCNINYIFALNYSEYRVTKDRECGK